MIEQSELTELVDYSPSTFLILHLGALFRHFWLLLAPSLGYLGPSWWPRGCPEASFGAILALSGGNLASLGAHLGTLGLTWVLLNSI